jgi:hypothetical protein
MTTETLIDKVREELGTLDVPVEQAIAATVKIMQGGKTTRVPLSTEERFISQNITLEEYVALPSEHKHRYFGEAEELNQRWIENQLTKLGAKWIMVVDGQVVLHGATLDDYPEDEDFFALCEKTGKYPFVFFSPLVFAIEELPTVCNKTKQPGDAYPAVSITVSGNNKHFETMADLDPGVVDCYRPLELLITNDVVKVQLKDPLYASKHLSQPFLYRTKRLWLKLVDETGVNRQLRTTIICVDGWQNSPFTAINPTRTFLLGRGALLKLRPRLILDFAAKRTEVQFVEEAS